MCPRTSLSALPDMWAGDERMGGRSGSGSSGGARASCGLASWQGDSVWSVCVSVMVAYPKPTASARQAAQRKRQRARRAREQRAKRRVRVRDRNRCRFPLCRASGPALQVAHLVHKGMGGNPAGDRSGEGGLILLCALHHQFGAISLHRGTLRVRPLTAKGTNGPVAWECRPVSGYMSIYEEIERRPLDVICLPLVNDQVKGGGA